MEIDRKTQLISYAQYALDSGLIPVPIKMALKRPYLPKWNETKREDAMRRFEREVNKGAADGIGILTGIPSNIVVVDVDDLNFWTTFVGDRQVPLNTIVVQTPGGGLHYYFKYDHCAEKLKNSTRIFGHGVDFRTTGGVITFVGNITADGRVYAIANGTDFRDLPEMPSWLCDWIHSYQVSVKRQ